MTKDDWASYEASLRAVILNGKFVQPEEVDPAKHKFIGLFRPATNPILNPDTDVLCRCGRILRFVGEEQEHYAKGCWDREQYVDI